MAGIFIVRHAEPVLTGALLGQCDSPLSPNGCEQAARLLRHVNLATVYTSPLRRALETARLLARGAPVEIVDDLREITYGEWDGKTWAGIEAEYPELARRKLENWRGVTPPGGEGWEDFAARVEGAFQRIARGPRPVAVVAHAAVNELAGAPGQAYGDVHEI